MLAATGGTSGSALNGFRVTADVLHVLSASTLLVGLLRHRSAFSVSVRTQELYMLVFITRYLDLGASLQYLYLAGDWTYSLLVYNTIGKVLLTERIPHAAVVCPTPVRTHTACPHTRTHRASMWGESRYSCGASPGAQQAWAHICM